MDLMYDEQKNDKGVKRLKIGLTIVFILVFLLILAAGGIFLYMNQLSKDQRKVTIDNTYNADLSSASSAIIMEDGKLYFSIKDLSKQIGYIPYNGEYKKYNEESSSCYATNQKELVTFTAGSKKIRKYPLLKDAQSQEFELEDEIFERANNLYISQKDVTRAFNTVINFSSETNDIKITTLPYLTTSYEKAVSNSYITDKEAEGQKADALTFNNQKALLEGLVVVRDENTGLVGVGKYDNGEITMVITERYASVEFIEGICDFIVQTSDKKFGIIDKEGVTKVKPGYDEIQEIEKDLGLYLVKSNNRPGIINQNGKTIVHQNYDQIGLENDSGDTNVQNKYLLYNKCIPVCVDKKWGLIDLNGNIMVSIEYDGIGCTLTRQQTNTTGVVLIPELNGIVVERDIKTNNTTIKKYGIVDATGSLIVNTIADLAYATTIANTTTYYLDIENKKIDIVYYWNEEKAKAEKQQQEAQQQNQQQSQQQEQTQQQQEQQTEQTEQVQQQMQQQIQQEQVQQQQIPQQQADVTFQE